MSTFCDCTACNGLSVLLEWLRGPQAVDTLLAANNLADVADPVVALANLGGQPLGQSGGAVDSVNGKTGVVVLATTDLADFSSAVDDRISTTMTAGAGIELQYTDIDDELTVSARSRTVTVTAATDTLTSADNGSMKVYTGATRCIVTLDDLTVDHETVLFSAGGGITVAPGTQTFRGPAPKLSVSSGQGLYVKQIAAGVWVVIGGTS